jgi:enhancing lycopene biosynthesis protein 2
MTLGKHDDNFPLSETIDFVSSLGHKVKELDVDDVCVDWKNLIITTPCFIQDDATYF